MTATLSSPTETRRLFDALRRRDMPEVQRAVAEGANLNARETSTGMTPLLVAAGLSDIDLVRVLVNAGADPFTVDAKGGGTALHRAVQAGDLSTVRYLLGRGLFVDAVAPTTGHTPLMDALWYKWPEVVEELLNADAGLNLSTHYGFSLKEHFEYELSVNMVGQDRLLVAEELLGRRIARDTATAESCALVNATAAGDTEVVRQLLAAGADVEQRLPVLNSFNDKHTALLVASRDGHLEIVRLLLTAGADVNAVEPTFGAVPLHKAVYNGHEQITEELAAAPGINLNYQGYTNGYTPLHDALWHGYVTCAEVLLRAGADTHILGHDGKTPYDVAIDSLGARHPLTRAIG